MSVVAEITLTMFAARRMNPEELDDGKAFDLLCGAEGDRQLACSYYYERYKELIVNCVRDRYRSLPSDLVIDAAHKAYIEFFETATTDPDFDPEKPQRLLLKIALRRACDHFRQHTHRGKFKEETLDEIAGALAGTETGEEWAAAVGSMQAREIQDLFRKALEDFADRQRKIARLMVDRLDDSIPDAKLAELYRESYHEPITVPAAKRARDEVRKKFRDILRRNGKHNHE
jgi:DNA-directed RNA polymerase specialized sigma24 family protein